NAAACKALNQVVMRWRENEDATAFAGHKPLQCRANPCRVQTLSFPTTPYHTHQVPDCRTDQEQNFHRHRID
ncbi:hypothetical protein GGI1_24681, partial [Acidithiobacillus sp. GGI-221]